MHNPQLIKFFKTNLSDDEFNKCMRVLNKKKNNYYDDYLVELIVGSYLESLGFLVKYEIGLDGKTPDWTLFNNQNEMIGICEVCQLYIDKKTDLNTTIDSISKPTIFTYWINENNTYRLYEANLAKEAVS